MRKALYVGVDFYKHFNSLGACVSDAESVFEALDRHEDGSKNFESVLLRAWKSLGVPPVDFDEEIHKADQPDMRTGFPVYGNMLTRDDLAFAVNVLFDTEADVVLFYFAGHGAIEDGRGYLCTSEITKPSEGMSLEYLMGVVSKSRAKHKIIILDSCHSGFAGRLDKLGEFSILPENTTILAACTEHSTAADGCFTPLMIEAMKGGAMNLVGEVSPGGIYSYIDRALGAWDQRPVFKANIKEFLCLRKNKAPIDLSDLRRIRDFFPEKQDEFPLDPSYEEDKRDVEDKTHNLEHEADFALLRKYVALNLVEPVGEKYMYWAAVRSKSCKLTALGRYYKGLVLNDVI